MAFIGVTAAVLMEGQPEEFGLLAVPLILGMGLAVGAINGAAVVLTRVPDIVVTLAARVLRVATTLTPTGADDVPVAFGWHPYLAPPEAPRTRAR